MTLRRLRARQLTPFGWVEMPTPPVWWRCATWVWIERVAWATVGVTIGHWLARMMP